MIRGYAAFQRRVKRRRIPCWILFAIPRSGRSCGNWSEFEREAIAPSRSKSSSRGRAQARWRSLAPCRINGHFLVPTDPIAAEWTRTRSCCRPSASPIPWVRTFDRFVNRRRRYRSGTRTPARSPFAQRQIDLEDGEVQAVNEPLVRTTMRGTLGCCRLSLSAVVPTDGLTRKISGWMTGVHNQTPERLHRASTR